MELSKIVNSFMSNATLSQKINLSDTTIEIKSLKNKWSILDHLIYSDTKQAEKNNSHIELGWKISSVAITLLIIAAIIYIKCKRKSTENRVILTATSPRKRKPEDPSSDNTEVIILQDR